MKKFLVIRTREGRESSFELETEAEVAEFLQGVPAGHYTVFARIDGLDFTNALFMRSQLLCMTTECV